MVRFQNCLAALAFSRSFKGMESYPYSSGETLPGQSPERYVGRRELAEIMGLSLATVDRMVGEDMPSVTWGRRTRRFRPSAAISWASLNALGCHRSYPATQVGPA